MCINVWPTHLLGDDVPFDIDLLGDVPYDNDLLGDVHCDNDLLGDIPCVNDLLGVVYCNDDLVGDVTSDNDLLGDVPCNNDSAGFATLYTPYVCQCRRMCHTLRTCVCQCRRMCHTIHTSVCQCRRMCQTLAPVGASVDGCVVRHNWILFFQLFPIYIYIYPISYIYIYIYILRHERASATEPQQISANIRSETVDTYRWTFLRNGRPNWKH